MKIPLNVPFEIQNFWKSAQILTKFLRKKNSREHTRNFLGFEPSNDATANSLNTFCYTLKLFMKNQTRIEHHNLKPDPTIASFSFFFSVGYKMFSWENFSSNNILYHIYRSHLYLYRRNNNLFLIQRCLKFNSFSLVQNLKTVK